MMRLIALLSPLLILLLPINAYATGCNPSTSADNAALKILQRQFSALQAIQRSRGCKGNTPGIGFFNPCREVTQKITEVQQQLIAIGSPNFNCKRKNLSPRFQDNLKKPQSAELQKKARSSFRTETKSTVARGPKNSLHFCVRLSDGYYFPTPHSQFSERLSYHLMLSQCRFICETSDMAVYTLYDPNDETADMVSVKNGQLYADLTASYNYHGEENFKRCNWAGYIARIRALQSPQENETTKTKVLSPPMPPSQGEHEFSRNDTKSDYKFEQNIRVIGTNFIPNPEIP